VAGHVQLLTEYVGLFRDPFVTAAGPNTRMNKIAVYRRGLRLGQQCLARGWGLFPANTMSQQQPLANDAANQELNGSQFYRGFQQNC
jgi:hypothetical protein